MKIYRMASIEIPILSSNKQVNYTSLQSSKEVTEIGVQNLDSARSEVYSKKTQIININIELSIG